jgi:acyl carrier protein
MNQKIRKENRPTIEMRARRWKNNKVCAEKEKNMLEKMIPIIAEQLNVNESEIKAESNFKDDLGADSLDLFELVMALEEEFGVEIPSEDLTSIVTVNDVVEYLKGKGVA